MEEWPEVGELVIGPVKKVFRHGAFVFLDEYEGKEGMIHISEISTTWIKNIRDHVRVGQKVVTKVMRVEKEKNQIDLSLKRVTDRQRKQKSQQWKRDQKSSKLFEIICEKLKKPISEVENELIPIFVEKFDDVFSGFELAAEKGETVLLDAGIPQEWAKEITELSKTTIEATFVEVRGDIELKCYAQDGIEQIKNLLIKVPKEIELPEKTTISTFYIGAPWYGIKVKAPDYPVAEKILKEAITNLEKSTKKAEWSFSFKRDR